MTFVIPRSKWGAKYGRYALGARTRSEVVIHITVNSEISANASQAVEEAAMRGVERYVVQRRRFHGFPYCFLGFQSGRMYEGQGWRNGQHTQRGRNRTAFALARFGHPDVAPSAAFLASGRKLFAEGLAQGHLTAGFRISGHRDHWPKACPGTPLYVRREELRPSHGPTTIEEDDVLQRGDEGAEVTVAQWRLMELLHGEADPRGAGKDYGMVVDGKFGPEMERYVRHVQAGFGYTKNPGKFDAWLGLRIERRLLELGRVKIPVGANGAAHTERGAD